jgi:leader peptidase (prepilin peptidase)/N-methyltransferase
LRSRGGISRDLWTTAGYSILVRRPIGHHPGMPYVLVVLAALGGVAAGVAARVVLDRLRTPVHPPVGVAEGVLAGIWALLAVRALSAAIPVWWLPVPAALAWLAVVLTATDLRHRRLPNALTLPAYPATALLVALAAATGPGAGLLLRASAAAAVLFAVHAVVHLAAPAHLGAGDVKLAGVVGAVLGAVSWSAVLLGPIIAAAVTAALAVIVKRDTPHGPGLLLAALLVAVFPAFGPAPV